MRSRHPVTPDGMGKRRLRRGRPRPPACRPRARPPKDACLPPASEFKRPSFLRTFFLSLLSLFPSLALFLFFLKECASGICEYKKVNKRGLVFNFSLPGPRARTKQFPGAAAAPARPRRDPTGSRPALGLLTPVLRSSLVRVSFQQLEAISESPASLISTE